MSISFFDFRNSLSNFFIKFRECLFRQADRLRDPLLGEPMHEMDGGVEIDHMPHTDDERDKGRRRVLQSRAPDAPALPDELIVHEFLFDILFVLGFKVVHREAIQPIQREHRLRAADRRHAQLHAQLRRRARSPADAGSRSRPRRGNRS